MNDIRFDHQIVVQKLCAILIVGKYPTDFGCCKEYISRPLALKKTNDLILEPQVEFGGGSADDIGIPTRYEFTVDR